MVWLLVLQTGPGGSELPPCYQTPASVRLLVTREALLVLVRECLQAGGWRWSAAAAQVVTRQQSHGNLLLPPHRATAARTAPPAEMGFSNLVSCKVEVQ